MTLGGLSVAPGRLNPIETTFNGDRFRSRREARFAVLLTELEVPYRYEMEGFDLGGVWYLPDFWLELAQTWVEIKGTTPTVDEVDKATRLALASGRPVVILWGAFRLDSFIADSLVFFKDVNGIFCAESGTAYLFLDIAFWFRRQLEAALTTARQARFEHGERGNARQLYRIR